MINDEGILQFPYDGILRHKPPLIFISKICSVKIQNWFWSSTGDHGIISNFNLSITLEKQCLLGWTPQFLWKVFQIIWILHAKCNMFSKIICLDWIMPWSLWLWNQISICKLAYSSAIILFPYIHGGGKTTELYLINGCLKVQLTSSKILVTFRNLVKQIY